MYWTMLSQLMVSQSEIFLQLFCPSIKIVLKHHSSDFFFVLVDILIGIYFFCSVAFIFRDHSRTLTIFFRLIFAVLFLLKLKWMQYIIDLESDIILHHLWHTFILSWEFDCRAIFQRKKKHNQMGKKTKKFIWLRLKIISKWIFMSVLIFAEHFIFVWMP